MKLYKTTINPISNFATSLKGDTLFGQICWAIRYKYGEDRLNELLSSYMDKPFLVVSDGLASGYLPKPLLPSALLGENSDEKKQNRKKIWLTQKELQNGNFSKAKTNKEVKNCDETSTIMRNSINYKTSTTGSDGFDPYGENESSVSPKDIFFLIDETFSLEELKDSFELLSQIGYGKDSSIGKGRFTFSSFEEVSIENNSHTFMVISPFSPQGLECKSIYYEPFTRFGKHGAELANKNAFKKPLILADTAAVVQFEYSQERLYIGRAIKGHSSFKDTVHQGYSITIPLKGLIDA